MQMRAEVILADNNWFVVVEHDGEEVIREQLSSKESGEKLIASLVDEMRKKTDGLDYLR